MGRQCGFEMQGVAWPQQRGRGILGYEGLRYVPY
jgi:hypothetical protein